MRLIGTLVGFFLIFGFISHWFNSRIEEDRMTRIKNMIAGELVKVNTRIDRCEMKLDRMEDILSAINMAKNR